MFTGIIQEVATAVKSFFKDGILHYSLACSLERIKGLEIGASVSVDGICQTVVEILIEEKRAILSFDAISETLAKTTLSFLKPGSLVNLERALRFGDEIGGHLLSGHVIGCATLDSIDEEPRSKKLLFRGSPEWMPYLFPKGFIAINGASLTLIEVDLENSLFSVQLIPETLKMTTFNNKKEGDLVNIEVEASIQAVVDTMRRLLQRSTF